jgi:hypothetical protein
MYFMPTGTSPSKYYDEMLARKISGLVKIEPLNNMVTARARFYEDDLPILILMS